MFYPYFLPQKAQNSTTLGILDHFSHFALAWFEIFLPQKAQISGLSN
jgi:hypothetical protein